MKTPPRAFSVGRDRHTPSEARQALDAISTGAIDAVVVEGPSGPQLFRLEGPDQPFRAFVERMQEGALTLSNDGRVLYANQTFAALAGVGVEEVYEQPFARFIAPGFRSTVTELVVRGLAETVRLECQMLAADGAIPVQLTLSPLTETTCCGVVFDLRDRELVEEAHAARAAAEEATRAKDQFLAVLSHELRSPLNTILGWSELLLVDGTLGPEARRAAQAIRRGAQAQAGLIADLLDISRIIAGKLHLDRAELDLGALVDSVLATSQPLLGNHRIVVHRETTTDALIHGDANRLQQIFTNLLNNALKFTDPGGTITITVRADRAHVVLDVADTGVGMSPELLGHVFETFQQGGSPRRKGGLGLGLAIAKQLAEAHDGTLVAASQGEGLGATFTLRVPRAVSAAQPDAVVAPPTELRGVRILLVDDDPDALELARFVVERAGAVVSAASTAEEALDLLGRDAFDLLVSDIGLPGQDGLALLREARARGHTSAMLPAIAVTGLAGVHDARMTSAVGYQKYFAKPIDSRTLVRAAAELVRG